MTYFIAVGELVGILEQSGDAELKALAERCELAIEGAVQAMGESLAKAVGVECTSHSSDIGGFMAGFEPKHAGQALPDIMEGFDDLEGWEDVAEEEQ